MSLRAKLLRLVYPWVSDALDQIEEPLTLQLAESLREVALNVAAADGASTLELCRDFWDYLVTMIDGGRASDRQMGVRPNAISPAERRFLTKFINSGNTRILDDTLRRTVAIFLELTAALGARRAEVLFIRGKDMQGDASYSVVIEEHPARSLKTPASTRIVPSVFFPLSLSEKVLELRIGQHPDDLLLRQQRIAGLRKVETIYQRANEILARLFGKDFSLHHLRHSLATWLAVQLNSEILDIKEFRGRCRIIDELLDSAPQALSLLGVNDLAHPCRTPC